MLNTTLKEQYVINAHKILLPEPKGEDNRLLAMSIADNFASLSFRLPNEAMEILSQCSREDLISFYQEYEPILEKMVGGHREYIPFYPNFPEDVMQRSEADFFFEQVIYGFSGFEIKPELYEEAVQRIPMLGYKAKHPLEIGSETDYQERIQKMLQSPIAFSPAQRTEITTYLENVERKERKQVLPKAELVPNHENRIVLADTLLRFKDDAGKRYLTDINDIVKYAAVLSARTDYEKGKGRIEEITEGGKYQPEHFLKYASLRYSENVHWTAKGMERQKATPSFNFKSADRKLILSLVERSIWKQGTHRTEVAMCNNKYEWKRIIRNIHISNYPYVSDDLKKVFDVITNNKVVEREARTVEEALKKKDVFTAMEASRKNPGDFVRRFDKLLCMGLAKGNVAPILDSLDDVAAQTAYKPLMDLIGHIESRVHENDQAPMRTFRTPSTGKVVQKEETRVPISRMIANMAKEKCINGLKEQMKGKDCFDKGSVFISPKTKDYKMPMDIRESSSGMQTYATGTKVDISTESDYKRLFVWWTNTEKNRVDIDLTATLYDKEGNIFRHIGWNGQYKLLGDEGHIAAIYSGDCQDGGNVHGKGAAEFIDLDCKVLRDMGVAYIIPDINSYCQELFTAMPNVSFGYMDRDSIDENHMDGDLFEASTVESQYALNARATSDLVCVLKLSEKEPEKGNQGIEMLWADIPYQGRVASRDQGYIKALIRQIEDKAVLSVDDMVRMNAEANGVSVISDVKEAHYIFATEKEMEELKELYPDVSWEEKEWIRPNDLDYLCGTLIVPGKKEEKEKTIDISRPLREILKGTEKKSELERDTERTTGEEMEK